MNTPKYKVGQYVNYTNDYGVKLRGARLIKKIADESNTLSQYGVHYFIECDSPWCPVSEKNLSPISE
jgi:hypothetical protein